ncbi:MAG: hypothetical protein V4515_13670 [Chloroflexota bacterium]
MALVKVTTPVPDYSGSVGGVHFADGQALVDDEAHEAELGYFRRSGYTVEDAATAAHLVDDEPKESAPMPAKNGSTEAWRGWAVEHGGMSVDEADALTRDQLVERFADSEENS